MAVLCLPVVIGADERIVLRDGSTRSGNLGSCNEQGCRVDGRRIGRDTIAAIVFDRDAAPDRAPKPLLRVDEVHLRDDRVVRAAVRAITADDVSTAAGDFGRDTVRVVFLSAAPPDAQPEILPDVLVLRDGQRKQGVLALCSQASCLLDRTSTPRDTVAWIGLGRGDAAPPQSDGNTVHLVTGEVLEKKLISITDDVLTTSARYARDEVAWIHLAPEPAPQPPINRFPPAPAPPETPPPPPPASSRRPPVAGPVGAGAPCPASAPMGGFIELTESGPDVFSSPECLHRNEKKMWFRLEPRAPLLPWPLRWTNTFHAPSVHYRVTLGPCRGPYDSGGTCVNAGDRARHDLSLDPASGNGMITYTPLSGELYVSLSGSAVREETRCRASTSSSSSDYSVDFGHLFISPTHCAAPHDPFSFCSNITPCAEPSAAADCGLQPQKYVTFPWAGTDRVQGRSPRIDTVVRWEVCCGCGEPPEGGMDPIERGRPDDPCDEIANLQRRLAELRDAAAQFARDLMAAQFRQKSVLLEKILSSEGTVTRTLLALISLLSNATGLGSAGDAIGALLDGNSIAEDPSGENIAAAVVGAAGTDLVVETVVTDGLVTGARQAGDYLARTNDAAGAVRKLEQAVENNAALRDKAKNVTGALGVIVASKGLYDNGSALGDSLQEYFDAGDDVRVNEEGLRDAENQILDVELELERLKRELEEPCAAATRFESSPFPLPMLSSHAGPSRLVRYPPQMATPPSASEAAQLTSEVTEVKRLLLEGEAETAKAVPLMLFFASPEARAAASPELIVVFARELRNRTQSASRSFRRAAELARRTVDEVRRQNPAALPASTDADASPSRPADHPARDWIASKRGSPRRASNRGSVAR